MLLQNIYVQSLLNSVVSGSLLIILLSFHSSGISQLQSVLL